eukprot:216306-Chlamydomonas_euryale.AAC.1
MSADAYASDSSCPRSMPMNVTGRPAKCDSSSARCGPSPTNARRTPGGRPSMMVLMLVRFFSTRLMEACRGGRG